MARADSSLQSGEVLAVLGSGMAGARLCERLAEPPGPRGRVVLIGDEPVPAYDRVRLGEVLGGAPPESLALRAEAWYRARGFDLRLACAVRGVDLAARTLRCADGATLAFDRLVLATGSAPVVPPVPGLAEAGAFTYRTLADARAIRAAGLAAARQGARAAVLGGGLLGLEAARLLQTLGCDVLVLERAPHLLPRQLPLVASRALGERLGALGLDLRAGVGLRAVSPAGERLRLELSDGASAEVALLVVAVGVRPRDELARAAGIACHPEGGVLVDDALRASHAGVYAIGECARHRGAVAGLAAPALAMADALAAQLTGGAARGYQPSLVATRLKVSGLEVAALGDTLAAGSGVELLTHADAEATRCLVLSGGRAIGAAAVGPWPDLAPLHAAIARGSRLGARARERFLRRGRIWRHAAEPPVSEWADAALVCACHAVTAGALRSALRDGARSAGALRERTRAGSGCGSCGALVDAFAGSEPVAPPRRSVDRGLAAAALLVFALIAALASLGPAPFAGSVQRERALERLWTSSAARQATGFAALGLSAATLVLSLRRRAPRLVRGSLAGWRVAHAAIGVAALAAVLLHTGLRAGQRLDRALLVSLLWISAVGAGAALAAAAEPHLPAPSRARLRRATARAHTLSLWPFPVLAGFHVLKVYWF